MTLPPGFSLKSETGAEQWDGERDKWQIKKKMSDAIRILWILITGSATKQCVNGWPMYTKKPNRLEPFGEERALAKQGKSADVKVGEIPEQPREITHGKSGWGWRICLRRK